MAKVFKNKSNEVRSGWKIAGVISLSSIMEFIPMFVFGIISSIYIMASSKGSVLSTTDVSTKLYDFMQKSTYGFLFTNTISFICMFLTLFIFLKHVDKKKFKDIGLISVKKGYKEFIFGLLLGLISMSVIFFVLLGTKNITVENLSSPNFSKDICLGLIVFIMVGIKEELLSRGYCITAFNQMKKPWLSIILSSILFSALHLLNPNVKPLGLINIILVGVLFGYMYVKTNNLWMPIGYHITWNYFQGCIYGFNVSGLNIKGLFNLSAMKDNILTGGAFGPEAGILTTIVIALGMLIVWKMPSVKKSEEAYIETSV